MRIVVSDHLPVAVEDCVVCHVESDGCCEESGKASLLMNQSTLRYVVVLPYISFRNVIPMQILGLAKSSIHFS